VYFPSYAENIGFTQGEKYNVEASESESVKVLSEAAKTEGVWLLGGPYRAPFPLFVAFT
jgi:omega-amidase